MTDLKTPLETPYLDREIERLEKFGSLQLPSDPMRIKEYKQIKAALKRLGELESNMEEEKRRAFNRGRTEGYWQGHN